MSSNILRLLEENKLLYSRSSQGLPPTHQPHSLTTLSRILPRFIRGENQAVERQTFFQTGSLEWIYRTLVMVASQIAKADAESLAVMMWDELPVASSAVVSVAPRAAPLNPRAKAFFELAYSHRSTAVGEGSWMGSHSIHQQPVPTAPILKFTPTTRSDQQTPKKSVPPANNTVKKSTATPSPKQTRCSLYKCPYSARLSPSIREGIETLLGRKFKYPETLWVALQVTKYGGGLDLPRANRPLEFYGDSILASAISGFWYFDHDTDLHAAHKMKSRIGCNSKVLKKKSKVRRMKEKSVSWLGKKFKRKSPVNN